MYVLTQSFPQFFDYFLIQPRRLVAVFLLRIPVFDPITVHLEFVVNRVAVGQVFFPSASIFPCHCHSTSAAYSY